MPPSMPLARQKRPRCSPDTRASAKASRKQEVDPGRRATELRTAERNGKANGLKNVRERSFRRLKVVRVRPSTVIDASYPAGGFGSQQLPGLDHRGEGIQPQGIARAPQMQLFAIGLGEDLQRAEPESTRSEFSHVRLARGRPVEAQVPHVGTGRKVTALLALKRREAPKSLSLSLLHAARPSAALQRGVTQRPSGPRRQPRRTW